MKANSGLRNQELDCASQLHSFTIVYVGTQACGDVMVVSIGMSFTRILCWAKGKPISLRIK